MKYEFGEWHDEFVAFLRGEEVQFKWGNLVNWHPVTKLSDFETDEINLRFRIKPINIPQTSQQIIKEMTKKFEEELREKEKAFKDAIDEIKVKHQIIEKPKQPKYLYVVSSKGSLGAWLSQTKDLLETEVYIGKIEVQDD